MAAEWRFFIMESKRIDKHNYYLDIAETVTERGTCLRRNYGAIIVKNDQIVATGYTGAPRGRENCCDTGVCIREKLAIPRGERPLKAYPPRSLLCAHTRGARPILDDCP